MYLRNTPPFTDLLNRIIPSAICSIPKPNASDVDKLDQFTPEWTDLKRFKHFGGWTRYVNGEADELAVKAIDSVGPCPARPRLRRRRHKPLDKHINEWLQKIRSDTEGGLTENITKTRQLYLYPSNLNLREKDEFR